MDIKKLKEQLRQATKTVNEATKTIRGAMASFDQLQRLKGKEVKISATVAPFGTEIVAYAEGIVKQVEEKFIVLLREKFPQLFAEKTWLEKLSGQMIGVARDAVTGIEGVFGQLGNDMPIIMGQSYAYVKSATAQMAQEVEGTMKSTLDSTKLSWTSGFSQLTDGVMAGCKKLTDYLGGDFREKVQSAMNFPLSKLPEVMSSGISSIMGNLFGSKATIPHLAEGAVLPANKPFLAVLGDQKSGTNVEAPLSVIQDAVAAVTGSQTQAILAGFQASVDVQREILEAVLGIRIGDELLCDAYSRYARKLAVVRGG